MDKALAERLRVWAAQYNTPAFIPDDPVSFPHRFSDRLDIEVSAFLTAWIAYGRREHILAKAGLLHDWMGESPYAFIMEADDEFAVLRGEASEGRRDTFYRFYTFADLRRLCRRLREIYRRYGSLEAAFASIPAGECPTRRLRRLFPDIVGIPSVTSGCACKRLAMFLRWMGRRDGIVDFGLWHESLDPDELLVPLDTHVRQVALELGLTRRKETSWRAAAEITDALREVFPGDPCLGDFALFGYDMDKTIRSALDLAKKELRQI